MRFYFSETYLLSKRKQDVSDLCDIYHDTEFHLNLTGSAAVENWLSAPHARQKETVRQILCCTQLIPGNKRLLQSEVPLLKSLCHLHSGFETPEGCSRFHSVASLSVWSSLCCQPLMLCTHRGRRMKSPIVAYVFRFWPGYKEVPCAFLLKAEIILSYPDFLLFTWWAKRQWFLHWHSTIM